MNTVKYNPQVSGIFQKRIRENSFKNSFNIQDWTKKTLIRLSVCSILFIFLFTLSKLNFNATNKIIEITRNSIYSEFDVVKNYEKAKIAINGFVAKGEQVWVVMNLERKGHVQYVMPVDGEILIYFGEIVPKSEIQSKGIVFETQEDQPVLAIGEGVVIEVGSNKAIGNYAILKHRGDMISIYKYIKENYVELNQKISTGEPIGTSTKLLQLEMWNKNEPVDPLQFIQQGTSKL